MLSEIHKGELALCAKILLSGLFPVVVVLSVSALSPLYVAAIGTGLAAVFFAVLLTVRRRWVFPASRAVWADMVLTALFIGVFFYALIFVGYKYTSAGNGAVMSLMEIFFTFVIVNLLVRHERFVFLHAVGALLMVVGALFILMPGWGGAVNVGDMIIVVATMAPPLGNMFAKRAREHVSADMLMFVRSVIGATFLFLLAAIFESAPSVSALRASWAVLLFQGVLYLGLSKLLWVEAIHRLPIAKTVSLSSLGIPLSLLFAWLLLDQGPTAAQLAATVPMIGGMILLVRR